MTKALENKRLNNMKSFFYYFGWDIIITGMPSNVTWENENCVSLLHVSFTVKILGCSPYSIIVFTVGSLTLSQTGSVGSIVFTEKSFKFVLSFCQ